MKKCTKCSKEKELTEFGMMYDNRYNIKRYRSSCKKCINKKSREEKSWEKRKEKIKLYQERNKEKIKRYNKLYKQNNKEKRKVYIAKRRKTDPMYVMKKRLRDRITQAFTFSSWKKNGTTTLLLGSDYKTVFTHLEKQFTAGMTWENRALWHIDHIIPLASAKTEEELIKLCHYTNLQPLWAEDNLKKGDKKFLF